jgi:hypothetical protein
MMCVSKTGLGTLAQALCASCAEVTDSGVDLREHALAGASYYVDPRLGDDTNPGTAAKPKKTIDGVRDMTNPTLLPGDTVILPAHYPVTVFDATHWSGTARNRTSGKPL